MSDEDDYEYEYDDDAMEEEFQYTDEEEEANDGEVALGTKYKDSACTDTAFSSDAGYFARYS